MKEAVQELLDNPSSVGTKSQLMKVYLKFFGRLFFKKAAFPFFIVDAPELRELTDAVLAKLAEISDAEFAALDLLLDFE